MGDLGPTLGHFGCSLRVRNQIGAPRVAEEAPWLKRLRASGVKFKMDQLDEPYLPWEKAQAATNSHSEEHGVSAEAGAEARAYHYDAETPSDAVEAGSEQDDSTNSWKRFYQE